MASWITGSSQEFAVDPIVQTITVLGDVIGNNDQETTDFFNLRKAVNSVALTLEAPLITLDCTETTVDGDLNATGNLQVDGTINGVPYPPAAPQLYTATYYKSAVQNLTSGNTDITFDLSGSWNNDGGKITHVDGTTDFTVTEAGLYQLEFNLTCVANASTWTTTSNKFVAIDITRSPTAEQSLLSSSALIASGTNYTQVAIATMYLEAGDILNCRVANTFTGGPPQAQCLQNTFDLNTFFTWTLIEASGGGGGGGGVASVSAGTKISVSGTATNPVINNEGVLDLTAGTGVSITGTNANYTIANDGVLELTAGSGISITGTKDNYTIDATAVSGNNLTINGTAQTAPGVVFNESANVNIVATASQTWDWKLKLAYIPISGAPSHTEAVGADKSYATYLWTAGTDLTFDMSGVIGVPLTFYLKNTMNHTGDDCDIKYDDGTGPVGVLGNYTTAFKGANNMNTGMQILIWDGAALTMY